jgi:hypothetical protein
MNTKSCLALVLTSALAIGCAAANAQDGQNPPPVPQPGGPPPEGGGPQGPRPPVDPAEVKRHLQAKLAEVEKKLEEVKAAKEDTEETRRRAEELRFHADRIRDHIAQIDRGEMPGPRGLGGPAGPRPPMDPDGRPRFEGPRDAARGRVLDAQGREVEAVVRRAQMRATGPSVEQRLEMLERAVRDMHEMFMRHGLPPEARERAEQEMRRRHEGGPPPMGGEPRPGAGAGEPPRMDKPPRPPAPRPEMPKLEMNDVEKAEVKSFLAAKEAELAAHMKQAAQQMEEMKRQLVDARAALEKAQAEIEKLRAEKAGK